jgi:hypothetical protein
MAPDIRVFDITQDDHFVPFEKTITLCNTYQLPIVGFRYQKFSGVAEFVSTLPQAVHIDSLLKEYELEGWVIRQKDQIAKIRKADLQIVLA